MKPKIYLAGGFRGGWHKHVINQLSEFFTIYNPQQHNLESVEKYTAWDLYHLDKCDIVLGFMDEKNPSGYGLALEIGYSKAKNKLVILVDEKSQSDKVFSRYFAICHQSADVVCRSIDEAIGYLQSFG
ncbi:nucleoside 2-deoxyribosyltransferase domain-containing protein [Sphingobacterium bambusae]|uniref:Nucleoside 2-deoxyribosyltransferase domain-containing protein n=1 Tax=Sphingobacterium bambusae TaxID=662858 RepID=A0ABW6BNW6_9SPHI|nr:nucleoside 2-deoxyribosyltransferase domain-containing protein [Sphingobacterium bambusae]WPL47908.1 nucleoside 2-deoxyribosyltransferase domain-containing protein [Sphingobacterium bambusae]